MTPLRVSVWLIGRYRNFALLIASVHLQDLPTFLIYQPLFYDLPYVQSKLQRKKDDSLQGSKSFVLMKNRVHIVRASYGSLEGTWALFGVTEGYLDPFLGLWGWSDPPPPPPTHPPANVLPCPTWVERMHDLPVVQ